MLRQSSALALAALLLAAAGCSDDNKNEVEETDAATQGDGGGGGPIGETGDGGSNPDGSAVDIDGSLENDGAVPGNNDNPDGATEPSQDGGVTTDASGIDAQAGDAAPEADATTSAPDGGACDYTGAGYGCGTAVGTTWVSFPDFDVDLANKVAWTKPQVVEDDDEIANLCPTLTAGGFTDWALPQMEDVRKLAAGCDKTMPGGSCLVDRNYVPVSASGDCDCDDGLVGPNNGKFCRADVTECEVLWVWTHTEESGVPYPHWFYDVDTGDIVSAEVGNGIATRAKGRCFHNLADSELPVLSAP